MKTEASRRNSHRHDMGRSLPDGLAACALSASYYSSSYVPLQKISAQITRTALTGDVERLDRLWQLLCLTYPLSNLVQCLSMPNDFTGKTILVSATEEKLVDVVTWLVNVGSEDDGMTIVGVQKPFSVPIVLERVKTEEGDTVLHIAAAYDASDIISLCHDKFSQIYDDEEANVRFIDWRNDKGASPLCIACKKGHLEVVETLLSLGASAELEDHQGDTPLHYAASYGHLPIVRLLLHHGASAFAKNNSGYSASDVAFSFEVEQDIQNTVRSAMEANKRLRSAKASAAATTMSLRSRHSDFSDEEEEEETSRIGLSIKTLEGPPDLAQTPKTAFSPPSRTSGSIGQSLGLIRPALSISTGVTPTSGSTLTTPISRVTSRELPQPSPSLDPESSKALQRILARDQNAQAGFQASTAYKGLVGPAIPSEASISPYSTLSKESGYFSSRAPASMRRGRSSSNEVIAGSYASSSATASSSSSSSPQTSIVQVTKSEQLQISLIPMGAPISFHDIPPVPPLPMPPHSALPALPSMPKSSASSFVNKLKRSGSSSAAPSFKPSGHVSPLDAVFPSDIGVPFGKRSLKHHASLADLRSQTAPVLAQGQAQPPQVPLISKSSFGFGKSRTRSGT